MEVQERNFSTLGYFPAVEKRQRIVAVDLGKQQDYTAINVGERVWKPIEPGAPGWVNTELQQQIHKPFLRLLHLERLPLGMDFTHQCVRIVQIVRAAGPNTRVVVDKSGVGDPVVDILRQRIDVVGVRITGGVGEKPDETRCSDWSVSKLLLVSMTQACFYRKAIRINARMPLASLLVKELQNFQANPTAAGNIQFSARSGQHDDIVLSLALLIWEAERNATRYGVTVTPLGL